MAVSDRLRALVAEMPDADGRGMYTTNIDKDKIEKAVAEIARGGRENVLGLVQMLGEPGSEANVKPHYALHCVANHVLVAGDEHARKELSEALASQLGGDLSKYNQAFLCQELQWAGRKEAIPALGKLLEDEELVDPAAMALVAIKEDAAEPLRSALPKARGRCRLAILDALAALADAESAPAMKEALKDPDREVRIAAAAGLAGVGDATAADLLLRAADDKQGWERVQITKQCLVLAEKLTAAGKKDLAARIYTHLSNTRTDPSEAYIRQLAEEALQAA